MLILFQDGEKAMTLIEPFKIEIIQFYVNPLSWEVVLVQNERVEALGIYDSLDAAKQVIQRFTKAYERGDMAFRVK